MPQPAFLKFIEPGVTPGPTHFNALVVKVNAIVQLLQDAAVEQLREDATVENLDKVELVCELAMRLWGTPYVWAGDDPIAGFDCSGMVVELLKSVGLIGRSEDLTAEGLRQRFRKVEQPGRGTLVFYGQTTATHVELMLDDDLAIGASGGGSKTQTPADAVAQNAYIKIRPHRSRADVLGYAYPF